MVFAAELLADVNSFINTHGTIIRIRKFTRTIGAGSFDDDVLLTSGVDTWTTGCIQPLGFNDNILVQQGFLFRDDLRCYVSSDVNVSGTWKLGIGSPPTNEYTLAKDNITESPHVNGSVIYQKMFLRKLTIGSLYGE